jgi:opacity protein-like surface antigen
MKKTLLLSAFLLHLTPMIHAFDVELRAAYFNPQDRHIRQIYGNNGLAEFEIELANPVINKHWAVWGNISYYRKHGRSACLHDKTHISNWAVTSGLKYYLCRSDPLSPYIGLGAGFDNVHFNNHSSYVQSIDQWGIATLAKSGVECKLTEWLFLDLFADYSYNWLRTKRSRHCLQSWNINTGGFKAGAGFIFRF